MLSFLLKSAAQRPVPQNAPSRHIPTLDGWRAIAILLVIAHHAGTAFYAEAEYYANSPTRFGTWGVPVFFGLSGVLITKLLLEEFDRTGAISLRAFYVRRAFRILPPALVYLATVASLGLLVSRTEAASVIFFFRNYLSDSVGGHYTNHYWSLSVEEHFYLIWPTILVLAGLRRGLAVAATLSVALGLWISADYHWHLFARVFPGVTSGFRSDLRLDGLFCGCTMAFLLHLPVTRHWLSRYYKFGIWLLTVAAFLYCLMYPPHFDSLWLSTIIPLAMVGTVLHPAWVVSRALEFRPLKWIGRISYSLYLWQEMFLVPSWQNKPLSILQQWPFNIFFVLLAACASYYLVEKPCMVLGHRFALRVKSFSFSKTLVTSKPYAAENSIHEPAELALASTTSTEFSRISPPAPDAIPGWEASNHDQGS